MSSNSILASIYTGYKSSDFKISLNCGPEIFRLLQMESTLLWTVDSCLIWFQDAC